MPVVDREKERQIVERARARGWTDDQIRQAVLAFREQATQSGQVEQPTIATTGFGVTQAQKETGQQMSESMKKRGEQFKDIYKQTAQGTINPLQTGIRTVGSAIGTASDVLGAGLSGLIKTFTPQKTEEEIKQKVEEIAQTPTGQTAISALQTISQAYKQLEESHPELAKDLGALGNIASIAPLPPIGQTISRTAKTAQKGVTTTARGLNKLSQSLSRVTPEVSLIGSIPTPSQSITQRGLAGLGTELLERIPRAGKRIKETVEEAAEKSARMQKATPAVREAIKVDVEQPTIDLISSFDKATLEGASKMHEIAEIAPTVRVSERVAPAKVAADSAVEQFNTIYKQKRKIGESIGEASNKLSKNQSVPVDKANQQMDDILKSIGVEDVTDRGKLVWGADTKIIPSEQKKIQQLYDEAVKGLDNATPSVIHKRDQVFSKLKRESRMDDIGEILIELPDGSNTSIFDAFRGIFSSILDEVSPEMRDLNRQYAQLARLTDDVENSIFRAPNFNVVKETDPAKFAEKNLRRLISDAQSAPTYTEIASQMDDIARQLGYIGAKPHDLIEYAEILRRLYPDTVPKNSFSGGISTGLTGLLSTTAGAVARAGKISVKDQREAILRIIKEMLEK